MVEDCTNIKMEISFKATTSEIKKEAEELTLSMKVEF